MSRPFPTSSFPRWWRLCMVGINKTSPSYPDGRSRLRPTKSILQPLFHARYIISSLGPAPQKSQPYSQWRSYVTDDFSLLEYSWNQGHPTSPSRIRYSIETIGSAAGTEKDPYNRLKTAELRRDIERLCPGLDWSWYELLENVFCEPVEHLKGRSATNRSYKSSSSSAFLPFWANIHIGVKAYFGPVATQQRGVTRLSTLKFNRSNPAPKEKITVVSKVITNL
jgi:DMATS type aromatic prenyltransferase